MFVLARTLFFLHILLINHHSFYETNKGIIDFQIKERNLNVYFTVSQKGMIINRCIKFEYDYLCI
jgi:hypothetical protein